MSKFTALILMVSITCVSLELTEENILKASLDYFSSGLYKYTAAENVDNNLVMSPLSAQIALGMLSLGAEGKTLDEIQSALKLSNKNITKAAFKRATSEYQDDNDVVEPLKLNWRGKPAYNPKPPTVRVVNRLFVKDGPDFVLNPEYQQMAIESFRSDVQNVDFSKKVEAANTINSWVQNKTNNKIKNLVSPNSLNDQIRLMLINAIYFKATWQHPFNPALTKKDSFFISTDESVEVDFMFKTRYIHNADLPEWNATAIKLPFYGNVYSMIFIVPKSVDGLKSVEEKIASANLEDIVKRMHLGHIRLSLPKFKIESEINLKEILPKMGITKMFTRAAEFTGLLNSGEALHVSDARQKAFIEIDEYGCEAAAATKVSMAVMSLPRLIKLNLPFYYAIVDGSGGRIFSGRLVNPK